MKRKAEQDSKLAIEDARERVAQAERKNLELLRQEQARIYPAFYESFYPGEIRRMEDRELKDMEEVHDIIRNNTNNRLNRMFGMNEIAARVSREMREAEETEIELARMQNESPQALWEATRDIEQRYSRELPRRIAEEKKRVADDNLEQILQEAQSQINQLVALRRGIPNINEDRQMEKQAFSAQMAAPSVFSPQEEFLEIQPLPVLPDTPTDRRVAPQFTPTDRRVPAHFTPGFPSPISPMTPMFGQEVADNVEEIPAARQPPESPESPEMSLPTLDAPLEERKAPEALRRAARDLLASLAEAEAQLSPMTPPRRATRNQRRQPGFNNEMSRVVFGSPNVLMPTALAFDSPNLGSANRRLDFEGDI